MVERSLSMREVLGSMPSTSNIEFCFVILLDLLTKIIRILALTSTVLHSVSCLENMYQKKFSWIRSHGNCYGQSLPLIFQSKSFVQNKFVWLFFQGQNCFQVFLCNRIRLNYFLQSNSKILHMSMFFERKDATGITRSIIVTSNDNFLNLYLGHGEASLVQW